MLDYVSLCNSAKKYYADLESEVTSRSQRQGFSVITSLTDSQIKWLDYFLNLECSPTCLRVLNIFHGTKRITKKEVSNKLGVSTSTVNVSLRDIYRVVNFCLEKVWDAEYNDLKARLETKSYSLVFLSELFNISDLSRSTRVAYINSFKRSGVMTLQDLLNEDSEKVVTFRGISRLTLEKLDFVLSDLGFDDLIDYPAVREKLNYVDLVRNASTKEEAEGYLLSLLVSRGYGKAVSYYRELWCK